MSVAPGLWPLEHSYRDKSARLFPAPFEKEIQAAFPVAPNHGWIYGFGSAWQTEVRMGKVRWSQTLSNTSMQPLKLARYVQLNDPRLQGEGFLPSLKGTLMVCDDGSLTCRLPW